MEIPDLLMTAVFLVTPPVLLAALRHRVRAVIYSVVALWLLMIAGSQYHLAYTPDYNSVAPDLSVVVGWFPSTLYTLGWLGVFALIGLGRTKSTDC